MRFHRARAIDQERDHAVGHERVPFEAKQAPFSGRTDQLREAPSVDAAMLFTERPAIALRDRQRRLQCVREPRHVDALGRDAFVEPLAKLAEQGFADQHARHYLAVIARGKGPITLLRRVEHAAFAGQRDGHVLVFVVLDVEPQRERRTRGLVVVLLWVILGIVQRLGADGSDHVAH